MKTLEQLKIEIRSRPLKESRNPYYLHRSEWNSIREELANLGGKSAFNNDHFLVSGAPVMVKEEEFDILFEAFIIQKNIDVVKEALASRKDDE